MTDLVSKLNEERERLERFRLRCISPDDGKYGEQSEDLVPYLSAEAEWRMFVRVQQALLETRVAFGQAQQEHLGTLNKAIEKFDPLNAALLERDKTIRHDQLAVLEELGNHMDETTKALLHPGTTSYDIVDTARAFLLKGCWNEVVRPKVAATIEKLCALSEEHEDILQVGRTHLQRTSPVPFSLTFALYAARLAERTEKCDTAFSHLKGKISGIVGTGASIDMVIGEGKSLAFEKAVLTRLDLEPDYTATQIVQKESLADVGHHVTTLMQVLGDFTNDMRLLSCEDIGEVTSREGAKRLGGSSADASKNNPIDYENTTGKSAVVASGISILFSMIQSDLQRDLRGSVQARYQPQGIIVQTYEGFCRVLQALDSLSINHDTVAKNLASVRRFPSEAMVAIMRGDGYVHPQYGVGHSTVKAFSKRAKEEGKPLLEVALQDQHFSQYFSRLSELKRNILQGQLELYVGSSAQRTAINKDYARTVARRL